MTFGRTIRALRLGWYTAPAMGAWVRLSDVGDKHFLIELAPIDQMPPRAGGNRRYRCIGPGRGATEVDADIMNHLRRILHIKRVKRPVAVVVDAYGNVVKVT